MLNTARELPTVHANVALRESKRMAKGRFWTRVRSTLFLLPAWFAPHKSLRVLFHRLRGVRIGHNVEIGYFCIIGHIHPSMIRIGDGAVVSARATVLEHDNSYYYTNGGRVDFGEVRIGERAFLGIATVVLPGVKIGDRAIVGAMSLVTRDVPGGTVVGGVPAKLLKSPPSCSQQSASIAMT